MINALKRRVGWSEINREPGQVKAGNGAKVEDGLGAVQVSR